MSTLRQQAAALPVLPGVYLFKNAAGEVLYVGKAVRLRERVRSYFGKDLEASRGAGLVQMVRDATTLDHQVAASEMEALLLEARLIRQYKPRYNIKLRDDKSFSLIRIDLSEEFPPIYISREKELEEMLIRLKRSRAGLSKVSQRIERQEFFGPYLSASSVKVALKALRRVWPFRDCSQAKYDTYARLGHGCLYERLGLCDAPCVARITPEEYRKNIDQIRMFLRGDRQKVTETLKAEMEQCAKEERFEQAAKCRNRLQSLIHLQDVAETRRFVGNQQRSNLYRYDPETDLMVECFDISNIQGAYAVGSQIVGVVRRGKIEPVSTPEEIRRRFYLDRSRYRKYRIKTVEGVSDVDMLREVLTRRMRRGKIELSHWAFPDFMLVDGGKGQLSVIRGVRAEQGLTDQLKVGSVAKGPTRRRVDLYGDQWEEWPMLSRVAWQTVAELLREEAHRFAISYYRRVHRTSLVGS